MKRIILTLLVALLCACGPGAAGGGASPEQAAIVVMGERANEETGAVEHYPECMAVAVAPTAILTAAHCEPVGDAFLIVDAPTWQRTASGVAFADLAFDAGEIRTLVPRQPLLNWLVPGEARDGPASFVVVRDSDIVALPTVLTGDDQMTGALEHGDSGAAVVQGGLLVGIVQTCTAPDDVTCTGGGRFSRLP